VCKQGRWFYKCVDCLSVMAVDNRLTPQYASVTPNAHGVSYAYKLGTCGLCNGKLEEMGQVKGTALTKPGERCPCDERCTSASGPNCNCQCGGENHGSGRMAQVEIIVGNVPRVTPANDSAALTRAAEYRAALAPLAEWLRVTRERKQTGWIAPEIYSKFMSVDNLVSKARASRTHKARMELLAFAATK